VSGVNKVILLGNVGKDPEFKEAANGILSFSVATNEKWKDKAGQWVEKTEWHNVVLFGPRAKGLGSFLTKGNTVFVEGRLQTRSWDGKDGGKRYTTEVVATNVEVIGGRGGERKPRDRDEDWGNDSGAHNAGDADDVPF
jgi:single-strand DNA-binding protein